MRETERERDGWGERERERKREKRDIETIGISQLEIRAWNINHNNLH